MTDMAVQSFNLEDLIRGRRLFTVYQPLISMRKKAVFGFEALTRGYAPDSTQSISPDKLFALAQEHGIRLELDRLCREKALDGFACLHKNTMSALHDLNWYTQVNEAPGGPTWRESAYHQSVVFWKALNSITLFISV
jgi:EAL domain-containing protein (putative c-di-GMP-specific phosphodiesterase class I)